MRLPDGIWIPSTKGLQQLAPLRFVGRAIANNLATFVDAIISLPDREKVLILTNWAIICTAGAAQTTTRAVLSMRPEQGGTDFDIGYIEERNTPIQSDVGFGSTELVIMPGSVLNARGIFNAGVAANFVTLNVFGYLVDRGNWQFGGSST